MTRVALKTCGCGKEWLESWEGRLEHRLLYGHAPSGDKGGKA